MHKVAIVAKQNTPEADQCSRELTAWLGKHGAQVLPVEYGGHDPSPLQVATPILPPETTLVVVLGGDGTMLAAARGVVRAGLQMVPILGVNMGGLGFLTAISPDELIPAMDKVLNGDFEAPPRMMLSARVRRDGQEPVHLTALNDVVVNKAALARIVELKTCVESSQLTTFRADGLIVSTPTGSTAYNLSAGGPICHPALDCLVVTPICPFALSNRPIILPAESGLAVEVGDKAGDTTLTCDGQVGFELRPKDRVTIRRAEQTVQIIRSPFKDYFQILRSKLGWG